MSLVIGLGTEDGTGPRRESARRGNRGDDETGPRMGPARRLRVDLGDVGERRQILRQTTRPSADRSSSSLSPWSSPRGPVRVWLARRRSERARKNAGASDDQAGRVGRARVDRSWVALVVWARSAQQGSLQATIQHANPRLSPRRELTHRLPDRDAPSIGSRRPSRPGPVRCWIGTRTHGEEEDRWGIRRRLRDVGPVYLSRRRGSTTSASHSPPGPRAANGRGRARSEQTLTKSILYRDQSVGRHKATPVGSVESRLCGLHLAFRIGEETSYRAPSRPPLA